METKEVHWVQKMIDHAIEQERERIVNTIKSVNFANREVRAIPKGTSKDGLVDLGYTQAREDIIKAIKKVHGK